MFIFNFMKQKKNCAIFDIFAITNVVGPLLNFQPSLALSLWDNDSNIYMNILLFPLRWILAYVQKLHWYMRPNWLIWDWEKRLYNRRVDSIFQILRSARNYFLCCPKKSWGKGAREFRQKKTDGSNKWELFLSFAVYRDFRRRDLSVFTGWKLKDGKLVLGHRSIIRMWPLQIFSPVATFVIWTFYRRGEIWHENTLNFRFWLS